MNRPFIRSDSLSTQAGIEGVMVFFGGHFHVKVMAGDLDRMEFADKLLHLHGLEDTETHDHLMEGYENLLKATERARTGMWN